MVSSPGQLKAVKLLTISLLSVGLSYVPKPEAAEAQVCNPFGCSQSGASACNPFGCPNPGASECTPFGCPASPGGFNAQPAAGNGSRNSGGNNSGGRNGSSTLSDINNGLGILNNLRQLTGGGNGGGNNGGDDRRSNNGNRRNGNDQDLNRILASYGLVPTDCTPGVVEIKVSSNLDRSVCAIPNAQYPAGLYVLNQEDYSISAIGNRQPSAMTQPVAQPTAQPMQPYMPTYAQPGQVMQQPYIQPQQPFIQQPQTGYGQPLPQQPYYSIPGQPTLQVQGTQVQGMQAQGVGQPQTTGAILMVGNPGQSVPPDIAAQIGASLAGRGLTPVSCSVNPGVTILVGQYMACSYPTLTYPAGRYTLR